MIIQKRVFNATIISSIVDLNSKTIILIIPGGGYCHVSNRESLPISVKFNMLGYNTAMLFYTTVPTFPCQPLVEGLKALEELSKEYDNIFVMGFSAGGHLAGLLGTLTSEYNVKGMILCYPVITLLDKTHEDTAHNFLGSEDKLEYRMKYSVQNCVGKSTVPCYIWTTKDDEVVPYENTLMMIEALNNNKVYCESKIYESGPHGLALADETAVVGNDKSYLNNEIAKWPYDVDKFIKTILKKK